jgi:hypothetical protein
MTVKTSAELKQGVKAEPKLALNAILTKELTQRILYIILGVGIILIVVGFISFLMK